jgi:hypothetical protein
MAPRKYVFLRGYVGLNFRLNLMCRAGDGKNHRKCCIFNSGEKAVCYDIATVDLVNSAIVQCFSPSQNHGAEQEIL